MSTGPIAVTERFCVDEDIAVRAGADFATLCPAWQTMASGTDGAIAAGSFMLTSATVNFAAVGVVSGMVVQFQKYYPPGSNNSKILNALYGVDSAVSSGSGGSVTLHQIGQSSGVGMPPGGSAGIASIEFLVATLGPQIEDASYEINRRFGIDDNFPGSRFADLVDPRELRQACVLTVLKRQFLDKARQATVSATSDILMAKHKSACEALDGTIDRIALHMKNAYPGLGSGYGEAAPRTRFSTRLAR